MYTTNMKHHLSLVFVLLLSSCSSDVSLSPEEVLTNAIQTSQQLDSVSITLEGAGMFTKSDTESVDLHIDATGTLHNQDRELELELEGNGVYTVGDSETAIDGSIGLILLNNNEIYVNLHTFSSEPVDAVMPEELRDHIAEKWYLIKGKESPVTSQLSVDPDLLSAQTKVIAFEEDLGTVLINGDPNYHYRISVDPEKLAELKQVDASEIDLTASGEVWIHQQTFQISKLSWDITKLELSNEQVLEGEIDLRFTNHNVANPITPPKEYLRFSPLMLLPFMDL